MFKDPIRDSGGATYSLEISSGLTPVSCDHKVSQSVTKCHKVSQIVTKCHKVSQSSLNAHLEMVVVSGEW